MNKILFSIAILAAVGNANAAGDAGVAKTVGTQAVKLAAGTASLGGAAVKVFLSPSRTVDGATERQMMLEAIREKQKSGGK